MKSTMLMVGTLIFLAVFCCNSAGSSPTRDAVDIEETIPAHFYFNMLLPVTWHVNKEAGGAIAPLEVHSDEESDPTDEHHEALYDLSIADWAPETVKTSFRIKGSPQTSWTLVAARRFRPGETGIYSIPIIIRDITRGPVRIATADITVELESPAPPPLRLDDGTSYISVCNYKDGAAGHHVGQVYAKNADLSDFFDKEYNWHPQSTPSPYFTVSKRGGFITAKEKIPAGRHLLRFRVRDLFRHQEADATLTVDVADISFQQIQHLSGSLRVSGIKAEDFIAGPEQLLRTQISKILGVGDVVIFSVKERIGRKGSLLDVFFALSGDHGAVLHPAEIKARLDDHRRSLETALDPVRIVAVNLDGCADEAKTASSSCDALGGCSSQLLIRPRPVYLQARNASFVGVDVEPICDMTRDQQDPQDPSSCRPEFCLNGGICNKDNVTWSRNPCQCPEGFDGTRCQRLDISFAGNGWAWYDPTPTASRGQIDLNFTAHNLNGLIFYSGPRTAPIPTTSNNNDRADFMALELKEGSPVFFLNLGSKTQRLDFNGRSFYLVDGLSHHVQIRWNRSSIEMELDGKYWQRTTVQLSGIDQFFNSNGPLQLGKFSDNNFRKIRKSFSNWNAELFPTTTEGFSGCIHNLTISGKTYDLAGSLRMRRTESFCPLQLPPSAVLQFRDPAGLPLGVGGTYGLILSVVAILMGLAGYLYVKIIRNPMKYKKKIMDKGAEEYTELNGRELNKITIDDKTTLV